MSATKPRTLFDKIWDAHVVKALGDGTALLYIDRHLVHEVTSPQAFEGLRTARRSVRRPDATIAVVDHNVPTDLLDSQVLRNLIALCRLLHLSATLLNLGCRTYRLVVDVRA